MCSKVKLHIMAMALVLIGALNWGFTAANFNLVEKLAEATNENVAPIVYGLVALSAVYLLLDRDTFLPFLGQTAFPCGLLKSSKPQGANLKVPVETGIPNSQVVYWAAEPSQSADRDYVSAYAGYKNSGVVSTDANGVAVLTVRPPTGYNVPSRKLDAHIHFRTCLKNGLLGEVNTVNV